MRKSAVAGRRRRVVWVLVVGALSGLVAGPTGWFVTDALERDNDFCISCHLTEGVPLHIDIRNDFDGAGDGALDGGLDGALSGSLGGASAVNLAAVHGAAQVEARSDRGEAAFRCIDCHGGTGLVGRAKVKVLAAKDAFWYLTGEFDEPHEMAWPLEDADCRKCHGEFQTKAGEFEAPAFHDLPLHNRDLGVDCVECHIVHLPGDADNYFLDRQHTREQCARCHADFLD